MCGIIGVYKYKKIADKDNLSVRKGAGLMKHRGPDHTGVWNDANISMAHNKLSILDYSENSNQPVELERVVVAFNGEIYNYKELIKKYGLDDSGIDAHVIARLYQKIGIECLKELEGAFAITIYDKFTEKLYLCRDRIGVKPLVYIINSEGELFFSSEIKGLSAFDEIVLKINKRRIASDLLFWFWADKQETYFDKIYHVLPGQYLCIDKRKLSKYIYWNIPHNVRDVSDEELLNKLKDATFERLQGSAKYATLLSGGLDSSLLTGIIASEVDKVTSYTIAYDNSENNIDLDYAKEVVEMYDNIDHRINHVSKDLISNELLHKLTYHLEEVVWDKVYGSMFANYKRAVQDGYRIVINGQGADECLAGYYHDFVHYKFKKTMLTSVDLMFEYFVNDNIHDKAILNRNNIDEWKHCLKKTIDKNFPPNIGMYDSKDVVAYWAMKTYLQSNLIQEDRMSLANSCECRVPYTDYRFVTLAFSIDGNCKIVNDNEKVPLKRVGKEYLPESILNRQKQAFVNPKEKYNSIAYEYINSHNKKLVNSEVLSYIFDEKFLRNIKDCDFSFNPELVWKIMAISVFEDVF